MKIEVIIKNILYTGVKKHQSLDWIVWPLDLLKEDVVVDDRGNVSRDGEHIGFVKPDGMVYDAANKQVGRVTTKTVFNLENNAVGEVLGNKIQDSWNRKKVAGAALLDITRVVLIN